MICDVLPDGYYAVPDPDGPDEPGKDAMTLWRVRYGSVMAYPKRAKYGPIPLHKDAPTDREERYEWVRAWGDLRQSWMGRVVEALRENPAAAQLRFGEHTARCCICGRVLTEGVSAAASADVSSPRACRGCSASDPTAATRSLTAC